MKIKAESEVSSILDISGHRFKADHILGRVFISIGVKDNPDITIYPHVIAIYSSVRNGRKVKYQLLSSFSDNCIYSFEGRAFSAFDRNEHNAPEIKVEYTEENMKEVAEHVFRSIEYSLKSDEHMSEHYVDKWFKAKTEKLRFPPPKSQANYQELWIENISLSNAKEKFIKRMRRKINEWLFTLEDAFRDRGIKGFINQLCAFLEGYRELGASFKTLRGFRSRLDKYQLELKKCLNNDGLKQYDFFMRPSEERSFHSNIPCTSTHLLMIMDGYQIELPWLDLLMELEWLLEDQTKILINSIDDHDKSLSLLSSSMISGIWEERGSQLTRDILSINTGKLIGKLAPKEEHYLMKKKKEKIILDSSQTELLAKLLAPRNSVYPILIVRYVRELIHDDLFDCGYIDPKEVDFAKDSEGLIHGVIFKRGYVGLAKLMTEKVGSRINPPRTKEALNYLNTIQTLDFDERTRHNLLLTTPHPRNKGIVLSMHSILHPVSKKGIAICPQLKLPYRGGKAGLTDLRVGMSLESLFVKRSGEYIGRYRADKTNAYIIVNDEDIEKMTLLDDGKDLWKKKTRFKKSLTRFIDGKHLKGEVIDEGFKIGLGESNRDAEIKYSRYIRSKEIGKAGGRASQRKKMAKLDKKK